MDERFMRLALDLADEAAAEGEVPVGAVVVYGGEVIGRGRNRRETAKNALAHAELEAIINARIDRVFFGAFDPKAGSCGSVVDLASLPYNHRPAITGGVLEPECREKLTRFFRSLREKD